MKFLKAFTDIFYTYAWDEDAGAYVSQGISIFRIGIGLSICIAAVGLATGNKGLDIVGVFGTLFSWYLSWNNERP